ncbi:hypothetical protein CRENBAI_009365 [Crenichthys baileyi]|uniref:Uncharacterized protein n=1 Tax=Crenichthys baileyi TaxID=28760 RepID=A0AAV9RB88_9TELE
MSARIHRTRMAAMSASTVVIVQPPDTERWRYEVYPVCGDLQGQILGCYKDNAGKTLNCSNIAALYLQCVNNAKQNKLRTGG